VTPTVSNKVQRKRSFSKTKFTWRRSSTGIEDGLLLTSGVSVHDRVLCTKTSLFLQYDNLY